MMQAIDRLQAEKEPRRSHRKPVKVLIPVNLRNLFPTRTLRNFASYITPEIDPRMGDFTFREICAAVHHRMGLENNPHTMQAKFAANVASERSPVLRVMPLFVKNLAMKLVFDAVGERKSCLCLSNDIHTGHHNRNCLTLDRCCLFKSHFCYRTQYLRI